jgi:hypothetical protein
LVDERPAELGLVEIGRVLPDGRLGEQAVGEASMPDVE